MRNLKNKKNDFFKIFITGVGSGLGKLAAIALARRGHEVFASVHFSSEIEFFEKIIISENLKIHVFCCDILNLEERNIILNCNVDFLLCNAAIGNSGSVCEVDINKIRKVFDTNVFAHLECIQLFIKDRINRNKDGRVIILSSLSGRIPMPFLSPYCATKFALDCFGTCLRQEMKILKKLKDINIEVCLIEPGAYATGFNKENNEKKYEWMDKDSYFSGHIDKLRRIETKVWRFLEQKSYNSIIKQYIKAVEDKHAKHRYSAPLWQTLFVQIGRIFGM